MSDNYHRSMHKRWVHSTSDPELLKPEAWEGHRMPDQIILVAEGEIETDEEEDES